MVISNNLLTMFSLPPTDHVWAILLPASKYRFNQKRDYGTKSGWLNRLKHIRHFTINKCYHLSCHYIIQ